MGEKIGEGSASTLTSLVLLPMVLLEVRRATKILKTEFSSMHFSVLKAFPTRVIRYSEWSTPSPSKRLHHDQTLTEAKIHDQELTKTECDVQQTLLDALQWTDSGIKLEFWV